MKLFGVAAAACAALTVSTASAHHSTAMFDKVEVIEITGTLAEFQWTNPHTWLEVDVPTDDGVVRWSVEGGSIRIMEGFGWTFRSVKPGDELTVTIHPLKNGKSGGMLMKVDLPNGEQLEWKPT